MVEWKKLGELGKFENIGTDKKIVDGEILVTLLNYVDVYHHKYIDSSVPQMQVSASDKKIVDCTVEQGDIFVTPSSETVDDIGHSAVITETIQNAVYSYHIMRYRLFEKNMLLSYYINYTFDTDNVKKQILKKAQGLTRFGLSKDKFASIFIPIPSLEEQTRIVGILDTFTSAIDNLKEQITQRRKQYEYYRDQLLDLEGKEGVEMKTLGEVCKLERGVRVVKKDLQEQGAIPVFQNSLTPLGFYEKSNYPEHTTFVICAGAAGEVGYSEIAFWAADDCTCIICPFSICSKYVYNYLMVKQHLLKAQVRKASVPRLSKDVIGKLKFPIPPLSEQERIVSILDTFEASIQNLEAQLKEREKQYEYYRNKLLTFE